MPSARDLLQQADALMRNNRHVGASGSEETVPVLTDVAVPGRTMQRGQREGEIPVLNRAVVRPDEDFNVLVPGDHPAARRFPPTQMESLLPLSEMPSMPQLEEGDSIIARRRNESRIDRPPEPDIAPDTRPKWLEADLLDTPLSGPRGWNAGATERTSSSVARQPEARAIEATLDAAKSGPAAAGETQASIHAPAPAHPLQPPAADPMPPARPMPPPAPASSALDTVQAHSAEEIAETVYFQVLQNLDLYTEHALQRHLTEHLSPIVERATQELMTTLNANMGALMRQFVADAIEKQLGVRPATQASPPALPQPSP